MNVYEWVVTLNVWYESSICVIRFGTWLIHMWDMNYSYVGHDSFICGTWLTHMWDMTHSNMGPDSSIRGIWRIHIWDKTHPYVGHDLFICGTWLIPPSGSWLHVKMQCNTYVYVLQWIAVSTSNPPPLQRWRRPTPATTHRRYWARYWHTITHCNTLQQR